MRESIGLIATEAVGPSAGSLFTVSDDFNRADNATLGGNWTTVFGYSDLSIVSNHANFTGSVGADYWNASFTNDQFSKVTITPNVPNLKCCVFVRHTVGTDRF